MFDTAVQFSCPAVVISTESLTELTLSYLIGDVFLVKNIEEHTNLPRMAADPVYVVTTSGVSAFTEIFESGVTPPSIIWDLSQSFTETLQAIPEVAVANQHAVVGIVVSSAAAVVTERCESKKVLDYRSFESGMSAAVLIQNQTAANHLGGQSLVTSAEVALLRRKHLDLLESLAAFRYVSPRSSAGKSVETQRDLKIEELQRRYSALEKKYNALASSKLGRLTLSVWRRKGVSHSFKLVGSDRS
ncbi:hypothetical protein [Arthrobacter tecti]